MQYIHGMEDFQLTQPTAVTLGKFDGIHKGHQKLIAQVKEAAARDGLLAAAYTFDSLPLSLCSQKNQHFLSTNAERRDFMEKLGLDVEIESPFTEKLMHTPAELFVEKIIAGQLKARYVVVGTDFCFGQNRTGNADLLVQMADQYGYKAIVMEKEKYQDREISSTYVREELTLGHMETVNVLLGRPYSIQGVVETGEQLGRQIQMPTLNIYPPSIKLLPPNGVYASATMIDGQNYFGVTNIGTRPTVSDGFTISVETHLFGYEGGQESLYGHKAEVQLHHFLRQEMKFGSVEELRRQMTSDAAFAREMFLLK